MAKKQKKRKREDYFVGEANEMIVDGKRFLDGKWVTVDPETSLPISKEEKEPTEETIAKKI